MANGTDSTQTTQLPVQTITKTKISVGQIASVVVGVLVTAGLLGFFTASYAYSALIGDFKMAAGKPAVKEKPALEVYLSPEVGDQTVIAGTQNHIFTRLILDASALTKDVEVREVNFTVTTNQASPSQVANFEIFDSDNPNIPLSVTNDPDSDTAFKDTEGESAVVSFIFSQPLVIINGTTKVLLVKGDVVSSAVDGTYQVGIQKFPKKSKMKIVAVYDLGRGKPVRSNYQYNFGPVMTFVPAGTLTIDVDYSFLGTRRVAAGTTGEKVASVRLKATNEDIDITRLTVRFADGGLPSVGDGSWIDIYKIYLWLDGEIVGSPDGYSIPAATKTINLTRGELTIPQGSNGKKLDIFADFVDIGINQPGTDGVDVKVGLSGANGFTAIGNGSAAYATKNYIDSTGSPVIIHKGVPYVVIYTPTNRLGATAALHQARITAIGDDIGIFRLSYLTSPSPGVEVSDVYTKLTSCSGSCGITDGSQLSDTLASGNDMGYWESWDLPVSSFQSHGRPYLKIAEDATAIIDLWAAVLLTTGSDTVSTSLLGDTATTTNNTTGDPVAAFTIHNQGNFVWSPLDEDSSYATSSLNTRQWYNGWYVSGLGLGNNSTTTPVTVGE
jgi:hypothetical protein